MSQLIAPTHTVVDKIPLGRRISEIMQEKGPAYTISAMAKRLDISRETLRLMLKGEREIYNYELDKIAQDLKVSVERILQRDISEMRKRFDELMSSYEDLETGELLSDKFLQCALGFTEKFYALNKRGIYLFKLRNLRQAHEVWLAAVPIAQTILEKYGDPETLVTITSNISITYANLKEKQPLLALITNVKDYFEEHLIKSGNICFSLARIEESEGNLDEALRTLYRYLDYMERSKNISQIAKARANLAFFEYRLKNYQKSIAMHMKALELVNESGDMYFKCNFYQSFARVFIRINQNEQAEQMLLAADRALSSITVIMENYYLFKAQQYFLLTITKNDPTYAEKIVEDDEYNLHFKKIACKFLIDYYDKVGNLELKEKFGKIIGQRFIALDMVLYEKDHDVQYLLSLLDLFVLVGWAQ